MIAAVGRHRFALWPSTIFVGLVCAHPRRTGVTGLNINNEAGCSSAKVTLHYSRQYSPSLPPFFFKRVDSLTIALGPVWVKPETCPRAFRCSESEPAVHRPSEVNISVVTSTILVFRQTLYKILRETWGMESTR